MDTVSAQSRDHLRRTIIDGITSSEASTRALKSRYNELAPISRLPSEVLASIFTLLPVFALNERSGLLSWIYVAHVCRRWREIALNHPRFWSRINLTKLTSDGRAEILARVKTAPLHLVVDIGRRAIGVEAIGRQLEAHISHTRHLIISGAFGTTLERLTSSAHTLESLTLSHKSPVRWLPPATIPGNLFNFTAPNLTNLQLENCDISWKSPILKGLRTLQIFDITTESRLGLEDWLDALNEMPELKTLFLRHATPLASLTNPLISKPSRTITLPSLTRFHICASARDCALALAHLVLPSLTFLHVDAESHDREGEDVLLVIPYVTRNVHVLQDTDPIRSILIASQRAYTEILAWGMADADVGVTDPVTVGDISLSACLQISAKGNKWRNGVDTAIFDALLTLFPLNSVSTFTAQNCTRLSKEFWLSHAPRLPLLGQARLVPTAIRSFRDTLVEDAPPDGPRFPSLTRLILLDVTLTALRTDHLRDMLIRRVEQGIPLEVLDLRTCVQVVSGRAIQLLAEIVVDVQEPLQVDAGIAGPIAVKEFFGFAGIRYSGEVEYDSGWIPWYCDVDVSEGEDENEK